MKDFGDLDKLIDLAKEEGVSFYIGYIEACDELSIEISSAAKAECFQMKRVINVDHFIKSYREHVFFRKVPACP